MQQWMSKIYQYLLVLLSILCVIVASEGLLVKTLIMSPKHWLKATETSGYIESSTKSINQSIEDLGLGSGIKAGTLEEVISEEQVREDFNSFLSNALKGTPFTIDQEAVKKKLNTSISEYAKEEGQTIDKTNQESIDQFVDAAYQKYDSSIRNRVISMIGLRTSLADKLLTTVVASAFGIFLLLIVLIYFAGKKYQHIFFRNVSHLFGATGLFLALINLVYNHNKPINDLTIFNNNMKDLINQGFQLPLIINWGLAVGYLVLGILSGVRSYNEYLNLKRRNFIKTNRQKD